MKTNQTMLRLVSCVMLFAFATVLQIASAPAADKDDRLSKMLTGRSEQARRKAIASVSGNIETIRQHAELLSDALREHDQQVADGRALMESSVMIAETLASTGSSECTDVLVEMLDSPTLEMSMICAGALGKHKIVDAIDAIKSQVARKEWKTHYGFRFNLCRALVMMQNADAYEFLKHVHDSIDGQLHHDLSDAFKNVTLDDFLGDEKRFADFRGYADVDESEVEQASYEGEQIQFARQQYYGIDIKAKRIMFVIDHSGSMKQPTYGGTRLTRAKQELIRAITHLPEDHEFAITFYESNVRVWQKELKYATTKNKADAIRFVSSLGYGGKTNTYGALRAAMDFDDDLEAVFLLSDGIPTCGDIVPAAGIVRDIVHRNRLRHLTVNTIGIAVAGQTEEFLRTLAQKCSGEFTAP